ncbi:MAG: 4Fe-4S double cluster binding domain-containing protein [Candidatus Adiutricales bacterium]
MNRMELSENVKLSLIEKGAALVGFADLTEIPPDDRHGLDYAVSIALSLNPSLAAQIINGPNQEYFAEYKRINKALLELARHTAGILQGQGHRAIYTAPTDVGIDPETHSTVLPHKTPATRSGLGWIGKCALLVTEEFGSAIRLTTVLTNAKLAAGQPVDQSRCGKCNDCVDACPGQAPSGKEWRVGLYRDSFFNPFFCRKTAWEKARKQDIDEIICGICISVCPWTRKFINQNDSS